ncbi:hypothetical protein GCM10022409_33860 [Hymenobacter glaciei]|uniref:Uncharacterized protein n=1 Tax=Hymenobacter glaciei TaxID=877209 RepID=A0ABP7UJG1_9BACT
METESNLPEYSTLFLDFPLYSKFKIESDAPTCFYLFHLLNFNGIIDAFCPACGRMSTFQGIGSENFVPSPENGKFDLGRMEVYGVRTNTSYFENKSWHIN